MRQQKGIEAQASPLSAAQLQCMEAFARMGVETFIYVMKMSNLSLNASRAAMAGGLPFSVGDQRENKQSLDEPTVPLGDIAAQTINIQTEWARRLAELQTQFAESVVEQINRTRSAVANGSSFRAH